MLRNKHYYGEIAAKISAHLYKNPDYIIQLDDLINTIEGEASIFCICADAARVFDTIEDLSDELSINWCKALDFYADEILDTILQGNNPQISDMISMASKSIEHSK